jgi:hypothetical protein
MASKAILSFIILILQTQLLLSQSLSVAGMNVVPHSIEVTMKYAKKHSKDRSEWVLLFVKNEGKNPVTIDSTLKLTINGKPPGEWRRKGKLAWHGFPEDMPNEAYPLPPGALCVWQLNGKNRRWLKGGAFDLVSDKKGLLNANLRPDSPKTYISRVLFGGGAGLYPSDCTIHLVNDQLTEVTIEEIVYWLPDEKGSKHALLPSLRVQKMDTYPSGKKLAGQARGILSVTGQQFLLCNVAVEVRLKNADGQAFSIWAFQKIRKESFDISGGWVNYPIGGQSSITVEPFLQTLRSLHINTAHYNGAKGYSDQRQPGGLFEKYPLKFFGHLLPVAAFDQDSILPLVHGLEIMGEPQYGGGTPVPPQKVWQELQPFSSSRMPTTLTHSEERIWRFYAGLSDYPHYDAYRVSAPAADVWTKYDRWGGQRIAWGSPLEGIGAMTRSLRNLNRPWPIAYWSQGPHEGWEVYGGRQRTSPTPSELRSQAYHALANGITSLYWFNLSWKSMAMFPDCLAPMQRVGREIKLLEGYYLKADLATYRQTSENGRPLWDLTTLVSPDAALLFALDLDYKADPVTKTFIFKGEGQASFEFDLPNWLGSNWVLVKIGENGPERIPHEKLASQRLRLTDQVAEVGIYLVLTKEKALDDLKQKYLQLLDFERNIGFDPAKNPTDFQRFMRLDKAD